MRSLTLKQSDDLAIFAYQSELINEDVYAMMRSSAVKKGTEPVTEHHLQLTDLLRPIVKEVLAGTPFERFIADETVLNAVLLTLDVAQGKLMFVPMGLIGWLSFIGVNHNHSFARRSFRNTYKAFSSLLVCLIYELNKELTKAVETINKNLTTVKEAS